jgi:hypothetical protein
MGIALQGAMPIMLFHESLINRLVDLYGTYGGFKDESRLKAVLKDLKVNVVRLPDGTHTLVYSGDNARGPR